MYDAGDKKNAFERLRVFTKNLQDDARLLARCHLTLGKWESELNDNLSEATIPHILASFKAATEYDDNWYRAWHSWALSNFEVITHYQKLGMQEKITPHLVPAVAGFFRSIALAPQGKSLQDTLRSVLARPSTSMLCLCVHTRRAVVPCARD
jgi:FKBP12-rapamycin complex-associated protein